MLGSYFANFYVQYIWSEGKMCADYMANEGIRVHMRIVWKVNFYQRFLEHMLKDISDFMYKRIYSLRTYLNKKSYI